MGVVVKFVDSLIDFFQPRQCEICGRRLALGEEVICSACNMLLPRTYQCLNQYGNNMVRLFWGRLRVERGAAFLYYHPQSPVSHLFYKLKYHDRPDIGVQLGRLAASEFDALGFFEGIDMIVPLPLSKHRERKRGYNQCREIAQGIAQLTGIRIADNVVHRVKDTVTQTSKHAAERFDNMSQAFRCEHPELLNGKHILLVDDLVTTGASLMSCAEEMQKNSDVLISIMTLGQTEL